MIHAQFDIPYIAIHPQSVNNASAVSATIDALGYAHAAFHVFVGDVAAACTVLKVQDSPDGTTWTDITGAALTGSSLHAATDDYKSFSIFVNHLGGRARYLKLVYTSGSGANNVAALAIMSRANSEPTTGTFSGVSGFSGWLAKSTPV